MYCYAASLIAGCNLVSNLLEAWLQLLDCADTFISSALVCVQASLCVILHLRAQVP